MQNIQDLKGKIFSESKNIIGILDRINSAEELLSRSELVDELTDRISFLRLLEKNLRYSGNASFSRTAGSMQITPEEETMEEEAVFNNELNGIDAQGNDLSGNKSEEEAIFNNQLHEIVEEKFHEALVGSSEENAEVKMPEMDGTALYSGSKQTEDPENEYDGRNEDSGHDNGSSRLSGYGTATEEEALFNNQLNEINEFENEISDPGTTDRFSNFEEEERIQERYEAIISDHQSPEKKQTAPAIFENEPLENPLGREEDNETCSMAFQALETGEFATDTSGTDSIIHNMEHESAAEERREASVLAEINDRRKITDIEKEVPDQGNDIPASDRDFEMRESGNPERKIKLSGIRGLKSVQSFFDDHHFEPKQPEEKQNPAQDTGSLLKSNVPTGFMEAEKKKPEFRLDLNDKIAFSKMLFGGNQAELNEVVDRLNTFRNLEEAKEYLSDLYYSHKWNKVDEYAQRLWVLVENKFL